MAQPKASIVIASYNSAPTLKKTLKGMLALDYPPGFEVLVVDDGSTDGTKEMLEKGFGKEKKIRVFHNPHGGVCKARNTGIKNAANPIIVIMDHDCIPEKGWLRGLVKGFDSEKVGVVSSFDSFGGGTSTAFRKSVLGRLGGFDERFYYYREDTDLVFRVIEAGYGVKRVKAKFFHDHKMVKPSGFLNLLKHAWQRILYHKNDVLLYKKHPKLGKEFLGVKFGFIVSPAKDFGVATNRWAGPGKKFALSSPRGITYIENKGLAHSLAIFLTGVAYMASLKVVRLYGSVKFGKLLV